MELRVLFDGQLPTAHLLSLPSQDGLRVGNLLRGSVGSRARRHWRLNHLAHVQDVAYQFTLAKQHGGQRIHQRVCRKVANDCAIPLARLHQADQFQGSNGIPYRTSADLELFRQFALGGQLVAGLQRPFNNLSLDLLGNLFVEFGLPDRLKFGFYRCYQVRSPRATGLVIRPLAHFISTPEGACQELSWLQAGSEIRRTWVHQANILRSALACPESVL